jgi:phosphopantothenoylcysteine decarboxylase/phosphopantothenate--cysteine ligase
MLAATLKQAPAGADVFVATAAVADWRPATQAEQRSRRTAPPAGAQLQFTENPDILATRGAVAPRASRRSCSAWALPPKATTCWPRQAKRVRKGVPLLVGNIGPATFGQDDNALLLVDAQGVRELARASKLELARKLIARYRKAGAGWPEP